MANQARSQPATLLRWASGMILVDAGDGPDPSQAPSLSLRFDLPGRSVVLTGDTEPSAAVATIRASRLAAPEAFFTAAKVHFAQHHLSAASAGQLARAADVGRIVFTHIGITPGRMAAAQAEQAQHWDGLVVFAADLDRHLRSTTGAVTRPRLPI
jgi:ribonuclease BN (tRNA processing enzyme)